MKHNLKSMESELERTRQHCKWVMQAVERMKDVSDAFHASFCHHASYTAIRLTLAKSGTRWKPNWEEALEIVTTLRPDVLSVFQFKKEGFQPKWAPPVGDERRQEPTGRFDVRLKQDGDLKSAEAILTVWLANGSPFGHDTRYFQLNIPVTPPNDWQVRVIHHKATRGHTGRVGYWETLPPLDMKSATKRNLYRNQGTAEGWSHVAYWDNVETFLTAALQEV